MLLHRNFWPCCLVGVFLPLCWAVRSSCSWQGENGKFFSFVSASLKIRAGKPSTPYTFPFWIVMLSFGHCVSRGFLGCQHPSPLCRPPQAAAPSWCLFLSALSCCLQDLPPAAVSMDAFPHQTRADSGCGAFSCLQAVLENSLPLSSEITCGVTDSFPGYHCAVRQDVGAQLGLTSRLFCIP